MSTLSDTYQASTVASNIWTVIVGVFTVIAVLVTWGSLCLPRRRQPLDAGDHASTVAHFRAEGLIPPALSYGDAVAEAVYLPAVVADLRQQLAAPGAAGSAGTGRLLC